MRVRFVQVSEINVSSSRIIVCYLFVVLSVDQHHWNQTLSLHSFGHVVKRGPSRFFADIQGLKPVKAENSTDLHGPFVSHEGC